MAKSTDILLDPATGDLRASAARDTLGLVAEGLAAGDAVRQHQAAVLQAAQGEFKEYPTLGADIAQMVCDHETAGWEREIALQLAAEGQIVRSVEVDITHNTLTIDADYGA